MAVDVSRVDLDRLAGFIGKLASAERQLFEQAFEQRVQASGADVFGLLVDLPGDFGDPLNAVCGKLDVQVFGFQQLAVLLGQRGVGLAENAREVMRGKGL